MALGPQSSHVPSGDVSDTRSLGLLWLSSQLLCTQCLVSSVCGRWRSPPVRVCCHGDEGGEGAAWERGGLRGREQTRSGWAAESSGGASECTLTPGRGGGGSATAEVVQVAESARFACQWLTYVKPASCHQIPTHQVAPASVEIMSLGLGALVCKMTHYPWQRLSVPSALKRSVPQLCFCFRLSPVLAWSQFLGQQKNGWAWTGEGSRASQRKARFLQRLL